MDTTPRRSTLATPAARRCGPHHRDAADLYRTAPPHLIFQFGESFGSISDPDMVDRIEHEVEREASKVDTDPDAGTFTLDECISALIAARWARRFPDEARRLADEWASHNPSFSYRAAA